MYETVSQQNAVVHTTTPPKLDGEIVKTNKQKHGNQPLCFG